MGSEGVLMVVGHSATAMPTGYKCYAVIIRVDSTAIASVTISGAAVTNLSWETVALLRGDYIPFETPITSITLTNDTDSVFCYLEHI
jgi:hypothetical protein